MKRKKISLLLVLILGMMALGGCGNKTAKPASGSEQTKKEADATVETQTTVTETDVATEPGEPVAEFDPNAEYDKYTLVYYIVEDIDARFTATVSAMDDGSKYEVRCNIDGEEQLVTLDKDLKITDDKTGNMSYDAPIIVQKAIDADNWTKIER